ncbi:MAG: CRISPR-associated helicase Cas3' [Candidatus Thiodiazotropha sp. (ex Lucinoma borealis)]|nr:CRISPR-associated helicase Cas3' [Candidatus Thiodiazotropha sp. (ex Lucinoma borealis)]
MLSIQNMRKTYYAHTGSDPEKSDWQRLSDHLHRVSIQAAENARYFGAEHIAEMCGLLHDLGKYSDEFAKRLEGGKRVDHATAGSKVAVEKWQQLGKLLAYVVAGHHVGLANGIDQGKGRATLKERMGRAIPELGEVWKEEITLPEQLNFPTFNIAENQEGFQCAFLVRMLYSCLVDADYLDTERFYLGLEGKQQQRGKCPLLKELRERLDNHLSGLVAKHAHCDPKSINGLRGRILNHARSQAWLEPGLFSLTVPTGGGKTLTSMAFALDHAIAHQQRRVIYVIPFTSIIEQNAGVFRDLFKELGEDVVLEHHNTFDDAGFDWREETKDKLRLAMENWDAPVVVTTAVQFFESLFADRSSRCRKLHNISGSVIILDEAQMLPQKLLRPTMAAIDELARNYRCSVVLCTATQPALRCSDEFYNGFEKVREIAPDPQQLYSQLDRVTVRHVGIQTDEQLAEQLRSTKQILIIVNNRRHARSLYDHIGNGDGHFHLTTLMCAKHRKEKLKKIRQRLKDGTPCKVVSTSLIEAGVDVDFPLVMRAESGLDSIAQAAGRCNREGVNAKEVSEVLIFSSPDWKAPPELEQQAASMRTVLRNHEGDLLAPDAITTYFRDLFWRNEELLDAKKLLKLHRDHYKRFSFPFQTIASEYRIIESFMCPIIIPFDKEAEQWIERLYHAEFVGRIAKRLQPYLVQVPERVFLALKSAGVIAEVGADRFNGQFWELINSSLYDDEAGLNWDDPIYIKAEQCVVS